MRQAVRGVALFAVLFSVAPAAGQDCRTGPCHRDVGRGPVIHEPVAEGDCTACHEGRRSGHPEEAGTEFRFAAPDGELCYGCHEAISAEASAARSVHEPVRRGACLECHFAHDSAYEALLKGKFHRDPAAQQPRRMPMDLENFALCWRCHDKYVAAMPATSAKTAFRDGTRNLHHVHLRGDEGYLCGACHRPHASAGEKLLGRPMKWTEDLVGFSKTADGGTCAAGCHQAKTYSRSE